MAEKRRFSIPPADLEDFAQKVMPRKRLEASRGGILPEADRKENEYGWNNTTNEDESQEAVREELEEILDKDYVPRRKLTGKLADLMSDCRPGQYTGSVPSRFVRTFTRPVVVPVQGPPVLEDNGALRFPGSAFSAERVETRKIYENPDSLLCKQSFAVGACGTWLQFGVHVDGLKLRHANFCRHRLCPLCNWRRGLKVFGNLKSMLDYLSDRDYRYIALTLTVRNALGEELTDTIERMISGWRMLTHDDIGVVSRSFWRRWRGEGPVVQGCFRSLEITINEKDDTYHPHFHVLLAVDKSYYQGKYLKTEDWVQLWKNACGLDYEPVVYVQSVDSDSHSVLYDLSKGDMGVSKEKIYYSDSDISRAGVPACGPRAGNVPDSYTSYISKSATKYAIELDFLSRSDDWDLKKRRLFDLFVALYRRRLISFSGCFREAARELRLQDAETGPLVDDGVEDDDIVSFCATWSYGAGGYKIRRLP